MSRNLVVATLVDASHHPAMARSPTATMTVSGSYFDVHAPKAADVRLHDIEHALEREQRFANHTNAPYELGGPATVAAHVFRVARIGWHLWTELVESGLAMPAGTVAGTTVRDRIEFTVALLLHDAAEAYMRDIPAPQKTDRRRKLERHVLAAIIDAVAKPYQSVRISEWIYTPARGLCDCIAMAQEALLFQPGASDWALPPESASGLAVTRSLIAETLPQFWRGRQSLSFVVTELLELSEAVGDPAHLRRKLDKPENPEQWAIDKVAEMIGWVP
ncbi:MAG: hypothetical protein M0R28_17740 [Pigmentiphaga sp.]|nr:hypothetical protein [Pigmentiphaga sp.]